MNPDLLQLHPYPFEKLNRLKQGLSPPNDRRPITLSVGEPRHPAPTIVNESVAAHLAGLSVYPTTRGTLELRTSIADWLQRRFDLPVGAMDPDRHILPVNGTREALFAFAQSVVDRSDYPAVLMPNPFYQIYEGAALLAGAEPVFVNTWESGAFLPEFEAVTDATWARCQLIYICTPGNPAGTVISEDTLIDLIELAHRHDFIVASDECYSEIYLDDDNPPPSLLQAAARTGNSDFSRCLVFHSLSKRSNLPGLRSGFVAGDATLIDSFYRYRTYHGCTMSPLVQALSAAAWHDDTHVAANRASYREKFAAVLPILDTRLDVRQPQAGFYLWPETPFSDTEFTAMLYARENVTVLPGRFLARDTPEGNPGANRVRIALVAPVEECVEAAERIAHFAEETPAAFNP